MLPIRSRSEFTYCTPAVYGASVEWRRGEGWRGTQACRRRGVRRRRPVRRGRFPLRLLRAEATVARRTIGNADGEPPDSTGWYGQRPPGSRRQGRAARRLLRGRVRRRVRAGDPGRPPRLRAWQRAPNRRVYLRSVAFVGAQTRDLSRQIDRALGVEPHVAVIMIGANDVTHSRLPSESVRLLALAVRRLREAGAEVVVGTCPDLGTIEPIAPPLKQVARLWSRRLAAAQTIATVEAGGRTGVAGLGARPGVRRDPGAALRTRPVPPLRCRLRLAWPRSCCPRCSPPSAWCRRRGAGAGGGPRRGDPADHARRRWRPPGTPGTEIDGTEVAGATRGARGRWVQLRRRRRQPEPEVESPQSASRRPPAPDRAPAQTTRAPRPESGAGLVVLWVDCRVSRRAGSRGSGAARCRSR